jgi:hypothetical protein
MENNVGLVKSPEVTVGVREEKEHDHGRAIVLKVERWRRWETLTQVTSGPVEQQEL